MRTRIFQLCCFLAVAVLLNAGELSARHRGYVYAGEFAPTTSEGEDACRSYFEPTQQTARAFFVGPTGRTMVLNMVSDPAGPLHGLNLTGLYGSGDFQVERKLATGEGTTILLVRGFIEPGFILFEIKVEMLNADGESTCRARADFTGWAQRL